MRRVFFLAVSILAISIFLAPRLPATQRGVRVTAKSGQSLYLYKDYRALVVGVGDYTKGWPDLPGAIKDAKEVAAVLKKHGFSVKLVLDPTSSGLKDALDDLAFTWGREKNRALLLYFAGHGETLELADGTELGYIIPSDCPLKSRDPRRFDRKAVSMKEIEALALKVKSKHLLMMFDSCFSGSLFSLTRAAPTDITEKSARPVRQFITAGEAGEQVPDRSVFKIVFLNGIKGDADLNDDGFVTGSELGMHLQDKVVNYSRGGQHPQYGKINNPRLDRGDFIFVLKRAPRPDEPRVATPPPPPVGIKDLDALIKKRRDVRSRWKGWQAKMDAAAKKAARYDKSGELEPEEKARVWKDFLGAYSADNPFSTKDEELRRKAKSQYALLTGKIREELQVKTRRPAKSLKLSFRVRGLVEHIAVREGDRIDKGQEIARLDSAWHSAVLDGAKADLMEGEATAREAKKEYGRTKELHRKQVSSRMQLDRAKARHEKSAAAVKSLESKLKLASLQLKRTRLTAPVAGRLEKVNIGVGERVKAGDTVALLTPWKKAPSLEFGSFYAIVIGNADYRELKDLSTPRNDARAISGVLEKSYGFKVTLIKDGTRAKIFNALSRYRRTLDERDNLLVYYSGHGWEDREAGRSYWLPVDAERASPAKWISTTDISNALKSINANHVLVLADSCYSSTLASGITVAARDNAYYRRMARKRSRTVMTSGGLEPVAQKGSTRGLSLFASAIVEALNKNRGLMDASLLFKEIRRAVMLNSDQTPGYGDIRNAGHQGGEFIFVRQKK